MGENCVLKFGGSTLVDGPSVALVCERILTQACERPVVVVSALKGVTDQLWQAFEQAHAHDSSPTSERAASNKPDSQGFGHGLRIRHRSVCRELGLPSDLLDRLWRELQGLLGKIRSAGAGEFGLRQSTTRDQVLSFGERASARIVAAALRQEGVLATPVDAFDLGFETQTEPGLSRLAPGVSDRIRPALDQIPGIPVVTGFLAKDPAGNLTTLGRDGSDWTAAIIARALRADSLIYWKDVAGILSADPRHFSGAQELERISLCEARELAFQGSQVLHSAALEDQFADRTQVSVRSVARDLTRGTVLTSSETRAGAVAIASQSRLVGLEFAGSSPDRIQALLSAALVALSRQYLVARMIVQSGAGATVWVPASPALFACTDSLPPHRRTSNDLASVALIGEGLGQHLDLYSMAMQALDRHGIAVQQTQFGSREHGQSFLIDTQHLQRAIQILHSEVVGTPLRMAR